MHSEKGRKDKVPHPQGKRFKYIEGEEYFEIHKGEWVQSADDPVGLCKTCRSHGGLALGLAVSLCFHTAESMVWDRFLALGVFFELPCRVWLANFPKGRTAVARQLDFSSVGASCKLTCVWPFAPHLVCQTRRLWALTLEGVLRTSDLGGCQGARVLGVGVDVGWCCRGLSGPVWGLVMANKRACTTKSYDF